MILTGLWSIAAGVALHLYPNDIDVIDPHHHLVGWAQIGAGVLVLGMLAVWHVWPNIDGRVADRWWIGVGSCIAGAALRGVMALRAAGEGRASWAQAANVTLYAWGIGAAALVLWRVIAAPGARLYPPRRRR